MCILRLDVHGFNILRRTTWTLFVVINVDVLFLFLKVVILVIYVNYT